MNFAVSEESARLVASVRGFVEEELCPLAEEVESKGVLEPDKAREIFLKAPGSGLLRHEHAGGGRRRWTQRCRHVPGSAIAGSCASATGHRNSTAGWSHGACCESERLWCCRTERRSSDQAARGRELAPQA